ncbi:type II toxin-antitoxin system HicA family toxin [Pseudomonadota bacterium]
MNSRQLIKRLRKHGFVLNRIGGSHHVFKHPDGRCVTIIHPQKDFPTGTLKAIFRSAGWD